ncbi:hypothetical protein F4809DRAFT_54554 [Biscogniauxia mediterranea]|nr:hypothetical protein F4809DRAFT_54554 [Biscogniauxia mediterranea]
MLVPFLFFSSPPPLISQPSFALFLTYSIPTNPTYPTYLTSSPPRPPYQHHTRRYYIADISRTICFDYWSTCHVARYLRHT